MDLRRTSSPWRELLAVVLVGLVIGFTAVGGYFLRSSTSSTREQASDLAAQSGALSQIAVDVMTGSSDRPMWRVIWPEVADAAQRITHSPEVSRVTSPSVMVRFHRSLLELNSTLNASTEGTAQALSSFAGEARILTASLSAARSRLQVEANKDSARANTLNVVTDFLGSLLVVLGAWYVVAARDRQRRERLEATTEVLERLKAMVAHGSEAIVVLDSASRVSWAGGPTSTIWSHPPAEMEGRRADAVVPSGHLRLLSELDLAHSNPGKPPEITHEFLEHPATDEIRVLQMRAFTLPRDDQGTDLVLTAQDITVPYQTRQALIRNEALLKAVLHSAPSAISVVDMDGRYLEVNPAWEQATRVPRTGALGRIPSEILEPDVAAQIMAANQEATEQGSATRDIHLQNGDEEQIFSSVRFVVQDDAGGAVAIASLVTDVTHQRLLRRQQRLLSAVVEESADAIFTLHNGRLQSWNTAAERMFGWNASTVVGRPLRDLLTTESQVTAVNQLRSQLNSSGALHAHRMEWFTPDGEAHVFAVSVTPLKDFEGEKSVMSVIVRDITQLEESTEALRYQAHHDPLTGLPNRLVLTDTVAQARSRAQSTEEFLAMAVIDLDNFKLINDSLGHPKGDELLRVVAERLSSSDHSYTTVRLGGDEFAVVWTPGTDESDLAAFAGELLARISLPISIDPPGEVNIGASIGITTAPCWSADTTTLLRQADLALYEAKKSGRSRYAVFTPELASDAQEEHALRNALRSAAERRQLEMHYQPIISLTTGEPVALEALMRWHHPDLGSVPPTRFIPLAEDTGEIVQLGMWALRQAAQDLLQFRELQPSLAMAVNVSGHQLDSRLTPAVRTILRDLGLPPEALILEITESVLVDTPSLRTTIFDLADLGVQLSIDDFGTGYSALNYLAALPIHKIKLDRSFIHGTSGSREHTALNASIIQLAHALDLKVVAEGIEHTSEAQLLTDQGCDYGQGYLWSAAVPAAHVSDLLQGRGMEAHIAGRSQRPINAGRWSALGTERSA